MAIDDEATMNMAINMAITAVRFVPDPEGFLFERLPRAAPKMPAATANMTRLATRGKMNEYASSAIGMLDRLREGIPVVELPVPETGRNEKLIPERKFSKKVITLPSTGAEVTERIEVPRGGGGMELKLVVIDEVPDTIGMIMEAATVPKKPRVRKKSETAAPADLSPFLESIATTKPATIHDTATMGK